MQLSSTSVLHVCLLFLAGLVLLAGCEEDVVAITGIDRAFTMYGVLTPEADTQRIAVYSIDGRLQPVQPVPLDGQVTSTNMINNERLSWSQQVVQDSLGLYAHVYSSGFVADYGTPYLIEVERSDGALSSAEVIVPPLTELELPPQLLSIPTVFPIRINGDAPNLIQIEIRYKVVFEAGSSVGVESYSVLYDGQAERTADGWIINVLVSRDMVTFRAILVENGTISSLTQIRPVELSVSLIVANEEWQAPGGVFDRDALAQPDLLTNVDNGFGFIGAGYRLSGRWAPVDSIIVPGQIPSTSNGNHANTP